MTTLTSRKPSRLAPWEERPSPAGQLGKGTLLAVILVAVLGPSTRSC
ncbi:hypothetical protein ACFQ0B_03545 [Nonomuraea thailandensis]